MTKTIVNTPNAPAAIGPYSQAVWAGNLLFCSGQIALDPKSGEMKNANLEEEIHQVMANIRAILSWEGLDLSHIVKSSIFLQSMDDFAVVNEIYASYFEPPYPARETVEVARLPKNANVEISVWAVKGH